MAIKKEDKKIYTEMQAEVSEKKDGSLSIDVRGNRPYSEEEMVAIAGVDLKKRVPGVLKTNHWDVTMKVPVPTGDDELAVDEVTKYKNDGMIRISRVGLSYIVRATNWQTKLDFQPMKDSQILMQSAMDHFLERIRKHAPRIKRVRPENSLKSRYAFEVSLYDAHIGKLAWHKETRMGNYNIEIACKAFLNALENLLQHGAAYCPELIIIPIGNDIMHAENFEGVTPLAGHSLDTDSRLQKAISEAKLTIIKAIEMARSIAKVKLKLVPGNHDMHAAHWMCQILDSVFEGDKFVDVDLTPGPHKVETWGKLMVGYTHAAVGAKANRIVNMLPHLWPNEWSRSKFREYHTGHQHKKQVTKYAPVETLGGAIIRQFPTLSSIDAWHNDFVFIDAVPAGEACLWDREEGVVAHYTSNVPPVTKD